MAAFCLSCFLFVFVRTFIATIGWALSVLIFVQLPLPAGLSRWVFDITETILQPIRRALPATMGIDFSPFVAIVLVQLVEGVLLRFLPL